jgi:hypothetical protein
MGTDADITIGALRQAVAAFVDARDWQSSRTQGTKMLAQHTARIEYSLSVFY